jgi:predicted metal-dependent HD superfamily phosphohydrolase
MDYPSLLQQAEAYVKQYFVEHHDSRLVYHNLQHTQRVVLSAVEIANHFQLSERDYCLVLVAAWFHDTGYFTIPATHEQEGADLATTFLQQHGAAAEDIAAVTGCILATKLPQSPQNLLEQIVCDADLYHLGTDAFTDGNKLLRIEQEALRGEKISKDKWRENTIKLLEHHRYHTDYARLMLQDQQYKHLDKLRKKLAGNDTETAAITAAPLPASSNPDTPAAETPKNKNKDKPDRGVETMFRITSNNNQRLSDMADNKAHIMITVNSIILSAIISLLLGKIAKQEFLAIPTYLILGVSVTTIIFSILATRPSLPAGKFTQQDLDDKKVNLLFFGNFYKMDLSRYTEGMWKVMDDKDFLYGSLIKDVYFQGVVLGRKYRLLRISYNVFMFGLILSVLAFVVASLLNNH